MATSVARSYQLEMLDASVSAGNALVCMDTGTGKTHVAILRMTHELMRRKNSKSRVWFICPTVVLADQQYKAATRHLASFAVTCFTGRDGPDTWTTQTIWDRFLLNVDVVVCTYDVLRHAIVHAFVTWQSLCLLVVDEAHNATKAHSVALLMDRYRQDRDDRGQTVPAVLGLSASPVGKGKPEHVKAIEHTMCCKIITPSVHRDDLLRHANRPDLEIVYVPVPDTDKLTDETVLNLLGKLAYEQDTDLVGRLMRTVKTIYEELGVDALTKLLILLQRHYGDAMGPVENFTKIFSGYQRYTDKLIRLFLLLKAVDETKGRAIIFVQTRSAAHILSNILNESIQTRGFIRAKSFVSASSLSNEAWSASLRPDQDVALQELRTGTINVLVATTVLEEGIDVSSCNLVVCYDFVQTYKSLIQRRGRARAGSSRIIILESDQKNVNKIHKWLANEQTLTDMFISGERVESPENDVDAPKVDPLVHPDTKAQIGLEDAVSHLYHYCAKLSHGDGIVAEPLFQAHQIGSKEVSCKVTLPASVEPGARFAFSNRTWDEFDDARKDAALVAYKKLYEYGLLNDHLLPLVPTFELEKSCGQGDNMVTIPAQRNPWPEAARALQRSMAYSSCAEEAFWYKVTMMLPHGIESVFWFCSKENIPMSPFDFVCSSMTIHVGPVDVTDVEPATLVSLTAFTAAGINAAFNLSKEVAMSLLPVLLSPRGIRKTCALEDLLLPTSKSSTNELPKHAQTTDFGLVRSSMTSRQRYLVMDFAPNNVLRIIALPKPLKPLDIPRVSSSDLSIAKVIDLDLESCYMDHVPLPCIEQVLIFPELLWQWRLRISAYSVSTKLWPATPLNEKTIPDLMRALTTPLASAHSNYQLLEFLGDSVLKHFTTVNLMALFPRLPEGALTAAKEDVVSNDRLAQVAIRTGIAPFIGTERLADKTQRVSLGLFQLAASRTISTKVLADVVEAIVAVSYLHFGETGTTKLLSILIKGVAWTPPTTCAAVLQEKHRAHAVDQSFTSTEQYTSAQRLSGHIFQQPTLFRTALTHHSCIGEPHLPSYERVEFLGDAVYELLITKTLAKFDLKPVEMHRIRAALANRHFQAYCVLSQVDEYQLSAPAPAFLEQLRGVKYNQRNGVVVQTTQETRKRSLVDFVRAAPGSGVHELLQQAKDRFDKHRDSIKRGLHKAEKHPWVALISMNMPKLVADILESVLGAVYIDSGGDEDACLHVLEHFGVMPYLRRVVETKCEVVHPVEKLNSLTGGQTIDFSRKDLDVNVDRRFRVTLKVDGKVVCSADACTNAAGEVMAAEKAISKLFASNETS